MSPSTNPADTSPFHAGERALQREAGVQEQMEACGRQIVRPYLPEQHRTFYRQLPFLVAAARDREQRVWATLLTGDPGFVRAADPTLLQVAAAPLAGDALDGALRAGVDLGLLGIELHSRRRNRVNGTLSHVDEHGMTLAVGQTFGNCPRYITERVWQAVAVDPAHVRASQGDALDGAARAWIAQSDTLFIASGYGEHRQGGGAQGLDASHRGGAPGFVRALSDTRLVIPDYAGNNHFNTMGNLRMDPRVGLLFVDFATGSLLQLTGRGRIDQDSQAIAQHPGAQRLIVVDVQRVNRLDGALPLRWREPAGDGRVDGPSRAAPNPALDGDSSPRGPASSPATCLVRGASGE